MARVAVEIPKIGLVMETVRITRWLRQVGETINAGEPLLEVESEKSMVEIESTVTGRLQEILADVDQELQVGDQIAWVETDAAAPSAQPPAPSTPVAPGAPRAAAQPARPAPAASAAPVVASPSSAAARAAPSRPRDDGRVRASPYAKRLAAEHGLDLRGVRGTGSGGRIESRDLQPMIASTGAPSVAGTPVPAHGEPLSPMRRALARAMSLSNATVPQFSVERSFDCGTLQALRAEYSAAAPAGAARLSVNDFLLQAVARTLIEQPAMNATFAGDASSASARLVPANGAHIGLVIAVEGGLLVPVIHDAEKLGLLELARRRRDAIKRSLEGRLRSDDLEGATFSISNLGVDGPDRFTAMINPPQSGILAVGRQRDCVVADSQGNPSVRAQSTLTLTVDHRVADGRLAAAFLARLVALLEGRDWRVE